MITQKSKLWLFKQFLKSLRMVPHFELMKKVAGFGVGGCLLEALANYRDRWKQFVRVDNVSKTLHITSCVPQGSLSGTQLSCFFVNDLPVVVKLMEHHIFESEIQFDLGKFAQ